MIIVHRSRGGCKSCRLQLLAIFEHGFGRPLPRIHPPQRLTIRARSQFPRKFATSARWRGPGNEEIRTSKEAAILQSGIPAETEALLKDSTEETVMRARQTFGDTLPKDFLSEEEYNLYERLYGPPVRETMGRDLEFLGINEELGVTKGGRSVLLRENAARDFEEVEFEMKDKPESIGEEMEDFLDVSNEEPIKVQAQTQREIDAILRLRKDMDVVAAQPVEEDNVDEEIEEWEEVEEEDEVYDDELDAIFGGDHARTHPHTMVGRWGTSPSTLTLPEGQFIAPITELLSRTNNKHLSEAAEKAFGGVGLPFSSSTPGSKKHLPQKHIGLEPGQHRMSEIEADAYIAGVMPGVYTAVTSTLVEVRKRLGQTWIRDLLFRKDGEGPRVLDAGGGGAGILAWRQIVQAEWDVLHDDQIVSGAQVTAGTSTVLAGPSTLRDRMSRLLSNTTFLPRLPDYIHSANSEKLLDGAPAQGRKTYDVIIAPHTLLPLKEDFRRKNQIQNLWTLLEPSGGVLILLEKGLPRGFEAIAGARSLLLNNHIASPNSTRRATPIESPETVAFINKERGMIVAPCTNHMACPMYKIEGLSSGRKDFCHFGQRFIRPPFLQRLLGAKLRNHEDVKFSYLAVRRGLDSRMPENEVGKGFAQGDEATAAAFEGHETPFIEQDGLDSTAEGEAVEKAFEPLTLPRAILPPLKRHGHVTLDVCTPSGTIERWTIPKSFSAQAYRDARKSKQGDLWALGAKTRTLRNIRLGRPLPGKGEEGEKGLRTKKRKGEKKERNMAGLGRKKKDVYEVLVGDKGMEGIREIKGGKADRGRRTKGGRIDRDDRKTRDLMKELAGDDDEDDDMPF